MYLQHFELNAMPFGLTPNTEFFLPLNSHREALQVMQMALCSGEGFIKITGEVGTGKTLLCRKLLNDLPQAFVCAYLPSPYLTPDELRWALARELGVSFDADVDQLQLTQLLQQRLVELHSEQRLVVLVVDETQAMPTESLEALRLLTNLETESRKLLQVVLLGQPELDQRLQQDELRQLRQRITFSFTLRELNLAEVEQYVNHRLQIAGHRGQPIFGRRQLRQLYRASGGVPRLLNVLCHKALLLCFGQGRWRISARDIRLAVQDTEAALAMRSRWPLALLVGVGVALSSGALVYWSMLG